MNKRQERQDKRNKKIVAVLNDHPTEVASLPALAEADADLRSRLGLVQPAVGQQLQGRQGIGATKTKNNLEAPLIGQLVKAANALSLYYKKNKKLDLALALHLRRSEYEKMTQPTLAAEAQDLADQITEHLADLAPYGYHKASGSTPASDKQLQAQVDAYVASIPGSSTVRGKSKVGTGTVRSVFKDIDDYVDGDFRSAVELIADDHQELYKLLREAMRIDDTGGGKKKKAAGGDAPVTPEA